MICPVCENKHDTRPIKCLQSATLGHVTECGISTEHITDCLLKQFNIYVKTNPQWKKGTSSN
jgi:hypothetical protein